MPMPVVLLAVPVVTACGMVLCGLFARLWFGRDDGVFRCKMRLRSGWYPGIPTEWTRGWTHARWVENVLLVQRGVVIPRVLALAVEELDGALCDAPHLRRTGLGAAPLTALARLDSVDVVEVAAADKDRMLLAGPFLAAAIQGIRQAPVDRP